MTSSSNMKDNMYLMTVPELLSAKEKLSAVASYYDPARYTFEGFQAKNLEPYEFRQQISRIFQIELTDKELGCITSYFDDGTGRIPLYLFMHEFFQLGRIRKERRQLASRQRRVAQETIVKQQRDEFLSTILPRSNMKLPQSWTEDEELSAFQKFNKIALTYDGHHHLIEVFYQFESLAPFDFMMQIWHNFEVEMTPEEVAALISKMKGDTDNRLDCSRFLFEFFRMRSEHLSQHNQYEFYMKERKANRESAFVEQFVERFAFTSPVKIWAATKDDMHSAFVKLKNAASYTRPDIFGNLRKAFDASDLDPTEFHKFLDRYFDVNLSPGELDATIRVFDLNGDGKISYGEFMTTFYQLGLEERSRRLMTQRTRAMNEEQARKDKANRHIEAYEQELRSHIVFPILPEDDEIEENQPLESLAPSDSRSSSAALPALSPSRDGKTGSKTRPGQIKSIVTQFPAISPATKDFLKQLEIEEKKIRKRRFKKPKSIKRNNTDSRGEDDKYAFKNGNSSSGVGGRNDSGGGRRGRGEEDDQALENWDFDPSSRVGGDMEHESASFVFDDESTANVAEVNDIDEKLENENMPRQGSSGSRPDSR